jgi:deaminated glutathione amidase
MRIAAVQLNSIDNKKENLTKAIKYIHEAAKNGAELVLLPEYMNYMGEDHNKLSNAETTFGETSSIISKTAKELGIFINLGSILEKTEENRAYNTSILFNASGESIATYRKIHLYDAEFEDRFTEKESDIIQPGSEVVTADTPFGKIGLTICYDIRFPELYRSLALHGAKIIFVPAAFPLYTGAHHWEILLRARAIENQCYIVAAGQIGTSKPNRTNYGNSMIVDPWGTVIARATEEEGYIISDISMTHLEKIRRNIPCFTHRRPETYLSELVVQQ